MTKENLNTVLISILLGLGGFSLMVNFNSNAKIAVLENSISRIDVINTSNDLRLNKGSIWMNQIENELSLLQEYTKECRDERR